MAIASALKQSKRFLSLDVFRGLTICLMIVVNTPGSGAKFYTAFTHASWFGFTLADLVFPSFLFAMGNAMSFSMPRFKNGTSAAFWKKIIKRSLIIFLIGYLMYWFPFFEYGTDGALQLKPISETRIMGVLQRIALCYFFTAILVHYFKTKWILIISGGILMVYWALLYLLGTNGHELEMATNGITWLDQTIFGESHMYKKDRISFDPEGLLSTLPAIVNVVAGYLAGAFIIKSGKSYKTIAQLLIAGVVLYAVALIWEVNFPLSKKLWTSSFVLYTVGIDLCIIALLIFSIELKQLKSGTYFFTVFGKNPLFIYLFSELFYVILVLIKTPSGLSVFDWVSQEFFQKLASGSFGALLTALVFMLLCWLLGYILDKKSIYIKI
ncbi:acyltransferase family protein [Leeuwenhoekiella sp. W20_SRS_FM14]|uniref:acyltransferase family protein n=1 Tax=Leeuwenhoekiella sp. W20_SRS_FM14 TaxID=3240270 RepID=UPI003F98066B